MGKQKKDTLQEYQEFVKDMKIYDGAGTEEGLKNYSLLALAEEVGELQSIYAKAWRDRTKIDKGKRDSELADVFFQAVANIQDSGLTVEEVINISYVKLKDRKRRGVIGGSGDDR